MCLCVLFAGQLSSLHPPPISATPSNTLKLFLLILHQPPVLYIYWHDGIGLCNHHPSIPTTQLQRSRRWNKNRHGVNKCEADIIRRRGACASRWKRWRFRRPQLFRVSTPVRRHADSLTFCPATVWLKARARESFLIKKI